MKTLYFIALLTVTVLAGVLSGCVAAPPVTPAPYSGEDWVIAFTRFESGEWPEKIFLMDSDGTNVRQLTLEDGVRESFPRISPNGTRIAFARTTREGNYDIYLMSPDGSGRTKITNSPGDDNMPSWSPDGDRIAFASSAVAGNMEICVMAPDGSGRKQLTDDPARDMLPAWSPDGSRIAFLSDRGGSNRWWVMDPDGSNQRLMYDVNVWDEILNVPSLLLQGTWGLPVYSCGLFLAPIVTMEKQCVISIDVARGNPGPLTFWDSLNALEAPDGSIVITAFNHDNSSYYIRLLSSGQSQFLTGSPEQNIASSCAI
ncbi:TolB family protein, partial [Chloroflexota bacterium]